MRRRFAMSKAIALRDDYDAKLLRELNRSAQSRNV
jgi:hypothetical protein